MKKQNNQIKLGEHCFIAGMTGSGKTYLEKAYIAGFDNVIVLDTKGTFSFNDLIPDIPTFTTLDELMTFKEGKAIYRPNIYELNQEYYDLFFKWIYYRKNCVVAVDEVMSICETASQIPFFYKACLTRGRELNISVFSCTQRPKTIPLVTMSESSRFFIFDLNLEADRKRIMEIVNFNEIETKPSKIGGEHSFWYYDFKLEKPILAKLGGR